MKRNYFKLGSLFFLCALTYYSCSSTRSGNAGSEHFSKEERLRKDVVSYAKNQLGAKYKYGGTTPRGFDCSGFTSYVMNNFNIKLSHNSGNQAKEGKKIDVKSVQAGDLIFYKRSKVGKVFHVSLVINNNRKGIQVIHSTSRGVVIDNISESSYWRPKISSARNVISK